MTMILAALDLAAESEAGLGRAIQVSAAMSAELMLLPVVKAVKSAERSERV